MLVAAGVDIAHHVIRPVDPAPPHEGRQTVVQRLVVGLMSTRGAGNIRILGFCMPQRGQTSIHRERTHVDDVRRLVRTPLQARGEGLDRGQSEING